MKHLIQVQDLLIFILILLINHKFYNLHLQLYHINFLNFKNYMFKMNSFFYNNKKKYIFLKKLINLL